jgi:hypothetical protein
MLKHVGVTQKQFGETWDCMPSSMRFWAEGEDRYKAGYVCYVLGGLLIWLDYLLPADQVSGEVQRELEYVLTKSKYAGWEGVQEIMREAAHLPDFDGPRLLITNIQKAYGTLWHGHQKPTLIVSSEAIKEEAQAKIVSDYLVPVERFGRKGFKFNIAAWISSHEITDGKVYLLNEKEPEDARLSGWLQVG